MVLQNVMSPIFLMRKIIALMPTMAISSGKMPGAERVMLVARKMTSVVRG
jgi:hypothetical protein